MEKSISIYIHMPWCIHKCPYCDFNSHESSLSKISSEQDIYVDSLILESFQLKKYLKNKKIISIFFGGGTPSLISPHLIDKIISYLTKEYSLSNSCEITLEANPGGVDKSHFKEYAQVGINRISLGIQSFNDHFLKELERIHTANEAKLAIDEVRKYFDNFNIDLMFALPNQNLLELENDLDTLFSYEPKHISYYHLTIEPQTRFAKNVPNIPPSELADEMYELIIQKTRSLGYFHYETSAFARDNYQSIHNKNYWHYGDYIGLGAGAHSKITHHNKIFRFENTKNPKTYIQEVQKNSSKNLSQIPQQELPFEFMLNAFRLIEGFEVSEFSKTTFLDFDVIKKNVDILVKKGFINFDNNFIKPTELGQRFQNNLIEQFLN
jgi:putative oxygen-independent coproporphyrinogen III oxidase